LFSEFSGLPLKKLNLTLLASTAGIDLKLVTLFKRTYLLPTRTLKVVANDAIGPAFRTIITSPSSICQRYLVSSVRLLKSG